jgi:rod shape-determining protein MreC
LYLPSKIKLKYLAVFFVAVILFLLPFREALQRIFFFLSRQLTLSPRSVSERLQELRKENLILKLKLEDISQLEKENLRLRRAFDFKTQCAIDLIGVEVIAFSPSSWRRAVVVGAGADAGLVEGLYVVDESGSLVGKITEVHDDFSRILLVNDPAFNLPVFVGDQGFGLLKGNLSGATVSYIEDGDRIVEGDAVWLKLSSGASKLEVGKVAAIRKDNEKLFWDVEVKLALKASVFDKLFVVK